MRILLSNDDGILAPGLAALYAAMADLGQVDVVAPDTPQSAAGHGITIHSALAVRRVKLPAPAGASGLSVNGRPADCVRLAVRNLLAHRPDLVLSGINTGANVGINVFYSGTVAAAAEGAMFGIPSVAFSLSTEGEMDFAWAGRNCRAVLERLMTAGLEPGDLINVNIPACREGFPRGVRLVRQSTAGIEDVYVRHVDPEGVESYRLGDMYEFAAHDGETDVLALAEGFITVTPLHVDMTDHQRLAALRAIEGLGL